MLEVKKYDKLIAIDTAGRLRTQHKLTALPKVYVVEETYSDGSFKCYHVGSYERPLHFNKYGYPLFHFYSRLAIPVKLWKPYHLIPYDSQQNNP